MPRILGGLLALTILLNPHAACAADCYVSPQGADANPGTLEKPFRSLTRAQTAVRTMKAARQGKLAEGGLTVWLRGGRYELPETFVLMPED